MSYTPQPWYIAPAEDDPYEPICICSQHHTIAKLWLDDAPVEDFNREQRANARIMVLAPELIELLLLIVKRTPFTTTTEGIQLELNFDMIRRCQTVLKRAGVLP